MVRVQRWVGYLVSFGMGAVVAVGLLEGRIWHYWEAEAEATICRDSVRAHQMLHDAQRLSAIAAEARFKAGAVPPGAPGEAAPEPDLQHRFAPANCPGRWVEAQH